jgi:hypothetical protein
MGLAPSLKSVADNFEEHLIFLENLRTPDLRDIGYGVNWRIILKLLVK